MSVKVEYTCDRCGEPAREGVRVEGRLLNDRYSEGALAVVHGPRDLCTACFRAVWYGGGVEPEPVPARGSFCEGCGH